MNFKKYLLKLSSFVSLPLVSLASISCSNNQNIPRVDYELIDENYGLVFNSEGEITRYISYPGNDYTNIQIPEYLVNNTQNTLDEYKNYKQRITSIGNFVFSNNIINGIPCNPYAQYLNSIILPNSIEFIGLESFYGSSLKEIIFPDSVVKIYGGSFENCKNLTNVVLSKNTRYIGPGAFAGTPITSIIFPDTLTEIDFRAFDGTKLSGEIYIPDSVRTIDSYAFDGTQITKVSLPASCSYEPDSFPQGCKINVRQ